MPVSVVGGAAASIASVGVPVHCGSRGRLRLQVLLLRPVGQRPVTGTIGYPQKEMAMSQEPPLRKFESVRSTRGFGPFRPRGAVGSSARRRLPRRAAVLAAAALAPAAAHAAVEYASDGTNDAEFGFAIGQSGTLGLVGAPQATVGGVAGRGAAYVFRNLGAATGLVPQSVKLTASDGVQLSSFGSAISLNGSTGLIGADGADSAGFHVQGAAYLFRNLDTASNGPGGSITQNVKMTASDGVATDEFGSSTSLVYSGSGTTGLIGALGANSDQGAAYVFRGLDTATNASGGSVFQSVKLTASDGAANDLFGWTVSLSNISSGTIGLVGAEQAMVAGNSNRGAAYLFRNLDTANNVSGGSVTQTVKLVAGDGTAGDNFGRAVSLSGTAGLVGAVDAEVGSNLKQGAAYVFRNLDTATNSSGGFVTQSVKLTASDGAAGDGFGAAVSLSGPVGLVGTGFATVGGQTYAGAAYLFLHLDTAANSAGGSVTQDLKLTASGGAAANRFGSCVSLSGDVFNIGASTAVVGSFDTGKAYYGTVSSITTMDNGASQTISGISFVSQDDWVIGQTTNSNQLTISKGDTANVTAAGKGVYVGRTAGSNNNTLLVGGTVVATSVSVSAASGATGNLLQIANDGSTTAGSVNASSGITLNPGGTLLLSGRSTVTDRIGNATPLILAGGSFNLGGLSEGAGGTTGLGNLSVTAESTLDFGTGSAGNVVQFAGVGSHAAGQQLQVVDWENTPGAAGGPDRLTFAGVASAFTLAYPQSDVSFDGTPGYTTTQDGGYFEVDALITTPEPTSLLLVTVGVAPLALRRRRRPAADHR